MTEIAATDYAHADIGLVCALAIEVNPLLDRCKRVRKYTGGKFTFRGGVYDGIRLALVQSGMGFNGARRATLALLDAHTPNWVLSVGFAGALRDDMKPGDIVLADSIVDTHGQELAVDVGMPADPARGLFVGRFVTADSMARTVIEKRQLAADHHAIAVDMESLAVAQVCRDARKRFLAVRVVSDDLSADLPAEILSILGPTGSLRAGAALGAVWKRPGSIKDMWQLRQRANKAAERLATFLDGVLIQLHEAAAK
jgi:adenosylhomocysteine nucleosidase